VLDASALFVFLQNKPAANKVNQLLKEAIRERVEIPMSAGTTERFTERSCASMAPDRAAATISAVKPLPIRLVDATPQRAVHAADVKAKYKLYYADSFAAALAIEYKATLVSGESDFRKLGHGFPAVWLKG
jgi:predicted nucleic acid-binding protein